MKKFLARLFGHGYYLVMGIRVGNLSAVFQDMEGSLRALASLSEKYGSSVQRTNWTDEPFAAMEDDKDAIELAGLFKRYGSDKSTRHNYHLIYSYLLKGRRNDHLNILEIGLGKPSASVTADCASSKAFRDWTTKADIYGADIEERLLFNEERIKTFWVDQTKPETMKELAKKLPKFDLIIDDGLHTPWANFNTIGFALPLLKEEGTLVIEDILPRYEYWWTIFSAVIMKSFQCKLVKMRYSTACIIKRNHG